MKSVIKIFAAVLMLFMFSCSGKQNVTVNELQDEVKYLASEKLNGRLTGSEGDSLAADYIKLKFSEYGLVPAKDDGLERFKVNDKVSLGKENTFSVNGTSFLPEKDFTPTGFSENGTVKSEVVFAGYGFIIENDSVKWDDYKGIDIKGKFVLILRSDPEPDNQNSKYASFSNDRNKAMVAKDKGASGVILVNTQGFDNADNLDPVAKGAYSVGIPVFMIKRTVADAILLKSKHKVVDLEKEINKKMKPMSFATGTLAEAQAEIIQNMANTRNVVMVLPGEDPVLKNEYLIFGAHYDHLGTGGSGSGSRAVDTIGIHFGADDNASGVALLIELAGKFASTKNSHKRTLVFAAFSGEEEGLLGSKQFTDNPVIDIKKADVMLNFDMVGRLKDTKDVQVGGVGTASGLKELAQSVADTNKLRLTFTEEGSGPSDHSSFYSKNIPVLYFTTGAHEDYHTPKDTWEKINYQGMVDVSDLVFKMATRIANDTARLQFKESGQQSDTYKPARRRGITLGFMPDVTGSIKNGLKVEAVTPGRPGALGGLKKGDIITAVDGKPVNNIGDYMFRMTQVKLGQLITVDVLRNNKKEILLIQL